MEEGIKVLIVDDSAQTRENLKNILSLEKDMQVVGEGGNGQQAVERVRELHPDVVIMDVNMPGVDGIQATERLSIDHPLTSVIIMSADIDQEYIRQAMIAGARDYLIKPFTSDEVVTAIKRVYEKERLRRTREKGKNVRPVTASKIITLYSPHDGVGKTTLAANLAIALKQLSGDQVVLVDLNLQFGDLDLVLNLAPERTLADLAPHFQQMDAQMLDSFLSTHESGVRMLAAPPRPQYAETVTVYCVQHVLRLLKQSYQYIIVDAASAMNDTTLAALDVSDEIVLITNLDVPSLRNAKICLETMHELHYETEKVRVVINRATGEMGIKADEAENYLDHPVAVRVPSDGRVVVDAVNRGIPFVVSYPDAKVSTAINQLAHYFAPNATDAPVQDTAPTHRGLGMRLRQLLGASG